MNTPYKAVAAVGFDNKTWEVGGCISGNGCTTIRCGSRYMLDALRLARYQVRNRITELQIAGAPKLELDDAVKTLETMAALVAENQR